MAKPDESSPIFSFSCPNCRSRFATNPEYSGTEAICPKCRSNVTIPEPEETLATDPHEPPAVIQEANETAAMPRTPDGNGMMSRTTKQIRRMRILVWSALGVLAVVLGVVTGVLSLDREFLGWMRPSADVLQSEAHLGLPGETRAYDDLPVFVSEDDSSQNEDFYFRVRTNQVAWCAILQFAGTKQETRFWDVLSVAEYEVEEERIVDLPTKVKIVRLCDAVETAFLVKSAPPSGTEICFVLVAKTPEEVADKVRRLNQQLNKVTIGHIGLPERVKDRLEATRGAFQNPGSVDRSAEQKIEQFRKIPLCREDKLLIVWLVDASAG